MTALWQTEFALREESVDEAREALRARLEADGLPRQDALRLTLAMEDALVCCLPACRGAACRLSISRRLGSFEILLSVPGPALDPFEHAADEDFGSYEAGHYMLAHLGLSPTYSYEAGENRVVAAYRRPSRRGLSSPLLLTGLAALGGAGIGLLVRAISLPAAQALRSTVITPLLDTLFGALGTVVGPMMFISVILGIYNVGDTQRLGRIGRRLLGGFMAMNILSVLVGLAGALVIFPVVAGARAAGQSQWQVLVDMLLSIVPRNIITPFLEGNTLQITFMAAVIGITMVFMRERVSQLARTLEQLDLIIRRVLRFIGALVPLFVFLTLAQISLSGSFSQLLDVGRLILATSGFCLLVLIAQLLFVAYRCGLGPGALASRLMPIFLLALSTGSSAATYAPMREANEKDLGIDPDLLDFGQPIGCVLLKPGIAVFFVMLEFFAARAFGVSLGPSQYVIATLLALVLAIAVPPVAGGMISCFTLLLLQLGIPVEALALALAANTVIDFVITATDVSSLQMTLLYVDRRARR